MREGRLAPLWRSCDSPVRDRTCPAKEKNYELKLSHWVRSHPLQTELEDWGAAAKRPQGGTLKVEVFPPAARQGVRPVRLARDGIAESPM